MSGQVRIKTPPARIRIASLSGHCFWLEPNTEVNIPAIVLPEAMQKGCLPVDEGDAAIAMETKPQERSSQIHRSKLENDVETTIRLMLKDDLPNEFTAQGAPDAKAIGRRLKRRVTKDIRDKVWNERFGATR
jgi:hypothetical protein